MVYQDNHGWMAEPEVVVMMKPNWYAKIKLILLSLAILSNGLNPKAESQGNREVNKYNWAWEELESWDVSASRISPSGEYLICATTNEDTQLRPNFGPGAYVCGSRLSSNLPYFRHELEGEAIYVQTVACSYDAEYIAYVVDYDLFLLDRNGTELWQSGVAPCLQESVALSLDGNYLVVANYGNDPGVSGPTVWYYSTVSSSPLWTYTMCTTDCVTQGICISDDGRYVACLTIKRNMRTPTVFYFDTQSAVPEDPVWIYTNLNQAASRATLEMSADGAYIAYQANGVIAFFDNTVPAGGVKEPLWVHSGGGYSSIIHDSALSADGAWLVHGGPYLDSGLEVWMGVVELWDTSGSGSIKFQYETYIDRPSVAISADGGRVFFAGYNNLEFTSELGAFDTEGLLLWNYEATGFISCDLAGQYLLAGTGVVWGFNIRNYEPMYLFATELNQEPICSISAPAPEEVVMGIVTMTGGASDPDGSVSSVVAGFGGNYQQATDTSGIGDWSTWSIDLNLYGIPSGELVLSAEAVDGQVKYSYPATVEVTVVEVTPTPTVAPTVPATGTPSALPTATETVSPTPTVSPLPATPTPAQVDVRFELRLNGWLYSGGDILVLESFIQSFLTQSAWIIRIIALDVYGTLYFAPGWTLEVSYEQVYLTPFVGYQEQILGLELPAELQSAGPFYFFGGIVWSDTWELIGDLESEAFFFQ